MVNKTTQPRKSRKLLYNLPNHLARRRLSSHLSNDLIKKYDRRTMVLRKGDTVRVLRGDFRGTVGKVLEIDVKARRVHVEGVTVDKSDKTKKPRPIDPSNLEITKLDLTDKFRRDKIGEKEAPPEEAEAKAARKAKKTKGDAVADDAKADKASDDVAADEGVEPEAEGDAEEEEPAKKGKGKKKEESE